MADERPTVLSSAQQAILDEYDHNLAVYEELVGALRELVAQLSVEEGLVPAGVASRVKSVDSLAAKLARYPDIVDLSELRDLAGIRVIVFRPDEINDVRQLVYREFEVEEQEYHGREAVETFGYRGLHLAVRLGPKRRLLPAWRAFGDLRAEVQVHTVLQNAWSVISHDLDYKAKEHVPLETRRALFRLAALLESSDELLEEFCREAEGLRSRYRKAIEEESWEDIPLDIESIHLGWEPIADAAHRALGKPAQIQLEHPSADAIARLLDLAELCEITSLADLHESIAVMEKRSREVLNLLSEPDLPYPQTVDIAIGLALVLDEPRLQDDAHIWVGSELAAVLQDNG
jgi:ppGpp synthetase/RelA/SpoT-type nucleotidyltranferase